MGGIIAFGESAEDVWLVAGWAYRRFLGDVLATSAHDETFVYAIQQAEALQGLDLTPEAQDAPELSRKLYKAIKDVAMTTLEDPPGRLAGWREGLDVAGQTMYLDAVKQLLAILERADHRFH